MICISLVRRLFLMVSSFSLQANSDLHFLVASAAVNILSLYLKRQTLAKELRIGVSYPILLKKELFPVLIL